VVQLRRGIVLALGIAGLIGCGEQEATGCEQGSTAPGCVEQPPPEPPVRLVFPDAVLLPGPASAQRRSLPNDPKDTTFARGYFWFEGKAANAYRFSCASSMSACVVTVYDGNGKALTAISAGSAEATAIATFWNPRKEKVYVELKVRDFGGGAPATWSFEDLGPDDHSNAPLGAITGTLGATVAGRFDYPWDADVLRFDLLANHYYKSTCTSPAPLDCRMYVGQENETSQQYGVHPTYVRTFSTGTFVFALNANGEGVGTWSHVLEDLGADDRMNTVRLADALTLPAPAIRGRLEVPVDTDTFRFTPSADSRYRFTCDVAADGQPWALELRDANDFPLSRAPLEPGQPSMLTFTPPRGERFAVAVSTGGANRTGDYTCHLEDLGPGTGG
jgi:hypothetical protein